MFFLYINFLVRFFAVNSPISKSKGGVFVDSTLAYSKLKEIKGARLKWFNHYFDALNFVSSPIGESNFNNIYPPVIILFFTNFSV